MQKCRQSVAAILPRFFGVYLLLLSLLNLAAGLIGKSLPLSRTGICKSSHGFPTRALKFADPDQVEDEVSFQEEEGVNFQDPEDEDLLEETDDDEAEDGRSSAENPSDDYAQQSLLQLYARDRAWLTKATEIVLEYPLGQISFGDLERIKVLMAAWVRQRSKKAALAVESLLKRVVDDMRANNDEITVDAKMYSLAMDAWAKSGAEGSWDRAQHIHDAMVEIYKETGDETMRPTTGTYSILINAHGNRNSNEGLEQAERVLQEMIHSDDEHCKPDTISFNTLLEAYTKAKDKKRAVEKAQELYELMGELNIQRNSQTYTELQGIYGMSDLPGAPKKTMDILQTMIKNYKSGDVLSKPARVNYNNVLGALSRTSNDRTSADVAMRIIKAMETPVSEGGFDVEPDRMSYALAILACVRNNQEEDAERLLLRMEARAKADEQKRRAISSAAPPSVSLDIECFNVVVTALAKLRTPDAVERIIAIIGRMKKYAEAGQTNITPNVRTWNALLNALSRSRDKDAAERAEQVLRHMFEKTEKPNAFSYTAVLSAFQNSKDPKNAHRADELLREMEHLYYETGELETPPDVFHYTIVCNTWARSGLPVAPNRIAQIIAHMNELAEKGNPNVKPNARTYHALIDALTRVGPDGEAERLLDHLVLLEERGEKCMDAFCFNTVIISLCDRQEKDSGRRAEAVLDKMLQHSELNAKCKPSTRTFTRLIRHYERSKAPDAPYRAEYILNRMIARFKEGHSEVEPDAYAFGIVMNAYSSAKHADSGTTSERLLKQMNDLRVNHGAKKLLIDSATIYNVLLAWCASGDEDAGRRAEMHLDYMERKFDSGVSEMKPDERIYGMVLNAWSKSNCFDKARRALGIIKRMEVQAKKGHKDLQPNEHCLSLVINACAFTNSGPEAEAEAFTIAVSIFDKMVDSDYCRPSALAYGWFLQACGRLRGAPDAEKEEQIERAWVMCCKDGLVSPFVLQRFTGAAPDYLYKRLLKPVLAKFKTSHNETKEQLKFKVAPADLPKEWKKNVISELGANERQRSEWWKSP